jgi:ketosteroid isomerase-like protein
MLQGDLESLNALFHPDVKWHGGDPSAHGACRNREQVLDFIRQAQENSRVGDLVELVGVADKVVAVMRPPGDGAALRANLTTFRDGKVVEMVAFDSPESALAAARE